MENLEIKVSRKTRMVNLPRQFISVDGENLQSELVFSFIDEFVNGQARLEYEINGKKNYIILNKQSDTYTIPIKNILTINGQIDMQLVITESETENGIPVFKSNKFYLYCNESINAVNEAPDGYELWIDHANSKLNKIDEIAEIIKTDGAGDKYLSDDGTYKKIENIKQNDKYVSEIRLENKMLILSFNDETELSVDLSPLSNGSVVEELTEEQIQAINEMIATTGEELILEYDNDVLDVEFTIEDNNLIVTNNVAKLDFNINENGEMEAIY